MAKTLSMTADAANRSFSDLLKEAAGQAFTLFATLGAARRAAAAVEMQKRPSARDLRLLGISPEAFPRF